MMRLVRCGIQDPSIVACLAGTEVNVKQHHFVRRPFACSYGLRRKIGVSGIVESIVVGAFGLQLGACWKNQGLPKGVRHLPVKIPFWDVDQGHRIPIGQLRPGGKRSTNQVRMWRNAEKRYRPGYNVLRAKSFHLVGGYYEWTVDEALQVIQGRLDHQGPQGDGGELHP